MGLVGLTSTCRQGRIPSEGSRRGAASSQRSPAFLGPWPPPPPLQPAVAGHDPSHHVTLNSSAFLFRSRDPPIAWARLDNPGSPPRLKVTRLGTSIPSVTSVPPPRNLTCSQAPEMKMWASAYHVYMLWPTEPTQHAKTWIQ